MSGKFFDDVGRPDLVPHPSDPDLMVLKSPWAGIPAGFITDLASIPWLVKPLVGVSDMLLESKAEHQRQVRAVFHDWIYANHGAVRLYGMPVQFTRANADTFCFDGDFAVLAGLRLGGWWAWHNNRDGLQADDFALGWMTGEELHIALSLVTDSASRAEIRRAVKNHK